jgi:methylated-DNA-[protein]-cysteine S-methyltransferase
MKKRPTDLKCSVVKTCLGYVAFSYSENGIYSTTLPKKDAAKALKDIGPIPQKENIRMANAIKNVIEGRQKADVVLDTSDIGKFDLKVFSVLKKVKRGTAISYGKLSKSAGFSMSARAVGNSLSRNRHLLVIPCHRVIKSDGTLGGFSGGLKVKKELLENEGLKF